MARPYFNHPIDKLESLFREQPSNGGFLRKLVEELDYRSTDRAGKLRRAVETRLRELNEDPPQADELFHKRRAPEVPVIPTHASPEKGAATIAPPRTAPPPRQNEGSLPPITNTPDNILSAWTALEVLSPPSFRRPEDLAGGDRRAVASLDESALPWERDEKSRPNCRLYYQIVLGSMKMEPAIEQLIQRYGDTRPERPAANGNAVLAVVIVDKKGYLVQSPAVAVSSFGWGVMMALNGHLTDLARWNDVETDMVRRIERRLLNLSESEEEDEQRTRPLTRSALSRAYETLLRETGIPSEMVEPPSFAIRSYEYFKNPNAPEPLLLNSFFLNDLAWGRTLLREGKAPDNLKRYLGALPPQSRQDLLSKSAALEAAIAPAKTNLGRWPGPGRHPLVLLQQAAVNLAFSETTDGGLLGVNGPPGTGKTTLLRDIVAGVVTQRAEAMCQFDDPETAFLHSGEKLKVGDGFIHLYGLDPRLRGFEMVVASSNNKAVQNVSAELPGISAIAADATDLRYFKTLSDKLHERDTWGLSAAVLGNMGNRARFKQTFWWDEDLGLSGYLAAAAGNVRQIEEKDPVSGVVSYRPPKIVAEEKPPASHDEALRRWNAARKRFTEALEKSRAWQTWLESLRADILSLVGLMAANDAALTNRDAARADEQAALQSLEQVQRERYDAEQRIIGAEAARMSHLPIRPGFWSRLLRTAEARAWSERQKSLKAAEVHIRRVLEGVTRNLRAAEEGSRLAEDASRQAAVLFDDAADTLCQAQLRLREASKKHGVLLADEEFFAQEHGLKHQSAPWFPKEAQRVRDDVFIAAMNLHRAFIDAAAKPLRHNLGALMNSFSGRALPGAAKEALLPDLWSSLFLVVPLISTTFASVSRMLGRLPPESLGWLLVDEAGQALPQAAVGAIIRSRRAVIVGDPIQIQPVTSIPDTLTHAIAKRFGVDPDTYTAPTASTQTLADAASSFATEFPSKSGSRSVGVPLLVHRRCAEPMFGISNAIGYSGLMVQAKTPASSPIRDVLGPSTWIHVQGSAEDKWCPEEGAEVIRLLRRLAQAGVAPDLYVVTPFVIVADRLRLLVRVSGVLRGWIQDRDELQWTAERIGTVHTVQGREAQAVIFVLGASSPSQTGARGWAGGRPNLLNVAVSRAREVVYVIGNRQLWREAGVFFVIDHRLPS